MPLELRWQTGWVTVNFLPQIFIQSQWKVFLDVPGQVPACVLIKSGPLPLRFFLRALVKVNGKFSWNFLGKCLLVFLSSL